eukprot:3736083-Rhodomonas_salina.1
MTIAHPVLWCPWGPAPSQLVCPVRAPIRLERGIPAVVTALLLRNHTTHTIAGRCAGLRRESPGVGALETLTRTWH